jgi:glycosyltransferase involved in cell wall biosynthesis
MPRVSLQLVFYQAKKFLKDSIQSALEQTYQDFELVIVDDGSTDQSQKILEKFEDPRLRIFCRPHLGLISARQWALEHSKGEWTAIWDSDDISLPYRIEKLMAFVENYERNSPSIPLAAVSGQIIEMDQNKKILNRVKQFPIESDVISKNLGRSYSLCHGAAIYRTELAKKVGGYFLKDRLTGEDENLWLRLKSEGALCNLDDFLIYRRIHPDSLCSQAGFRVKYNSPERPIKTALGRKFVYCARVLKARWKGRNISKDKN